MFCGSEAAQFSRLSQSSRFSRSSKPLIISHFAKGHVLRCKTCPFALPFGIFYDAVCLLQNTIRPTKHILANKTNGSNKPDEPFLTYKIISSSLPSGGLGWVLGVRGVGIMLGCRMQLLRFFTFYFALRPI